MDEDVIRCLDARRTQEAFELVASRYRDRIYRIALAVLADEGLAEDAAQEALLRIWKSLSGFKRNAELRTWIYSISRNCALMVLASRKARAAGELDEDLLPAKFAAPARASHDVDGMLNTLRPQYQQVVRLFYMQEKSYEEVAEMLDLPMGTVKTVLHRARLELATMAAGRLMQKGTR